MDTLVKSDLELSNTLGDNVLLEQVTVTKKDNRMITYFQSFQNRLLYIYILVTSNRNPHLLQVL
jgi:hypothetical protein